MGGGGEGQSRFYKVFVPLEFKGRAWADSEMPALSISAVQVLQGQWAPVEVALKALTNSPQLIGL